MKVLVTPSCEAVVGWYGVFIETMSVHGEGDDKKEFQFRKEVLFDNKMCILFNAWCSGKCVI